MSDTTQSLVSKLIQYWHWMQNPWADECLGLQCLIAALMLALPMTAMAILLFDIGTTMSAHRHRQALLRNIAKIPDDEIVGWVRRLRYLRMRRTDADGEGSASDRDSGCEIEE